jgi:hypothetical protein
MKTHHVGNEIRRREAKQKPRGAQPAPTIGTGEDELMGRGERIGTPDLGAGQLGERIVSEERITGGWPGESDDNYSSPGDPNPQGDEL